LAWALPSHGSRGESHHVQGQDNYYQTQRILVLEGSLVGPWLSNLKGKWDEERRTHEGATFVLDLTKVTIVSQHGENILFQMFTGGARLVGNSLLARLVIQQVERRRNLQYAE
jgi:hypothetical protein